MNDAKWPPIESYADRVSAELLVGLLAGEGVPSRIAADEPIPGLARNFSVLVPAELEHRARWILKQASISDEELSHLAMGDIEDPTKGHS